jgi:hypothetical protein
MIITFLCPPALLYAVIMLIYLILELSNKKYKEALVKAIIGIIFTCILQAFCQMSLGLVSWIFVMIPIIFYTYITLLTFFVFRFDPSKQIKAKEKNKYENESDKWSPSKHVSSTPITTTLYTPSIVPVDSYSPKKDAPKASPDTLSIPVSDVPAPKSGFSYSHPVSTPKPTPTSTSKKILPVTACTKQTTSATCNSLSVCAWTGSTCINTSEFDSRINNLDISCANLSDSSCNYLDKCYLLSVSETESKCLPSIPSIGGLLNSSDCKTLLSQMKYDTSTNTKLSDTINTYGCSSIANRIYSILV